MPSRQRPSRRLRAAYRGCAVVQLRHDPTFWAATQRLPRPIRPAVRALYAYVRTADDLVDAPGDHVRPAQRRAALDTWEAALDHALAGGRPSSPVIAALVDAARRHELPLHELRWYMDSMRVDCGPVRIADRAELERYMRGSAEAVGIIMAQLLDGPPHELAQMGTAFQLTNFIRDVAEDWALDRIYLPGLRAEDLDVLSPARSSAAAVDADAVDADAARARVRERIGDEVGRARRLFADTDGVETRLHPHLRGGVRLARSVYGRVLDRVERRDFDVLGGQRALTAGDAARALAAR
jgi:phytoene synthase